MTNEENEKPGNMSGRDLCGGELVDQEPLETIEAPPSRLAGLNQIPDFGDDTKGTLREAGEKSSGE